MRIEGHIRNAALVMADAWTVAMVWTLAVLGYRAVGIGSYDPAFYLQMWPMMPFFISVNLLFRLYHGKWLYPSAPLSPVEEMRRLFGSAFITHVGLLAFLAFSRQTTQDYSRFVIGMSGILTALLAQPIRDLARHVLLKAGIGQIPVMVAGSGEAAERVCEVLQDNAYVGFRAVGYCDREGRKLGGLPRLGDLREVTRIARGLGVRTLIACEDERIFRCQLRDYLEWFTHIEYLPNASVFPVFGSQAISIGGIGGVEMVNQGRMPLLKLEKAVMDRMLAMLAFVLLLPLFVVIPVLIKLTSRGTVFYRQQRLGLRGKPIRIWKFRSMYENAEERLNRILSDDPSLAAEWEANHKLTQDPRITPLGRILRKTSLDELPQLFNVLDGSMALVGPRPIVKDEIARYGEAYEMFTSAKPGVTGLWQVSGRSGTDYATRVALDTQYVLNWSPWMDIWILIRTVYAVVFMRGSC